jgi:hypothetical protein
MRTRKCASCGSLRVHSSRRKSIPDWLAGALLLKPFRCADCEERYYDFFWAKKAPGTGSRRRRRRSRKNGDPNNRQSP